jgi:hypothetical protein
MKYLFLLLLVGCSGFTTSKHRCDNKIGLEKEACMESYKNYVRHIKYMDFRGGGNRNYFKATH